MGTLFKNGTVITAGEQSKADVLVEGEIVTLIGQDISPAGHEVIDYTGKYLLPGGIDVHTHLDLSFGGTYSNDDFDTGHKAAAFGGTTMHIDFAMQKRGGTLHEAIDLWNQKAKLAQIDYSYHVGIVDLRLQVKQMSGGVEAGHAADRAQQAGGLIGRVCPEGLVVRRIEGRAGDQQGHAGLEGFDMASAHPLLACFTEHVVIRVDLHIAESFGDG